MKGTLLDQIPDPEPSQDELSTTPEPSSATEPDPENQESEKCDDGHSHGGREAVHVPPKRRRTRTVKPPVRLMSVKVEKTLWTSYP